MLSVTDPAIGLIGAAIITAIVAPIWLSWWNTKQTKKEFRPNGGSSIRDSLNRLEVSVAATRQTSLTLASVIGVAYFQADSTGAYVYVSRDWQRMTGMFAEEALGGGWMQVVPKEERALIVSSWTEAVKEARPWRGKYHLKDGSEVLMMANPIKTNLGGLEGYVGFYEVSTDDQEIPEF